VFWTAAGQGVQKPPPRLAPCALQRPLILVPLHNKNPKQKPRGHILRDMSKPENKKTTPMGITEAEKSDAVVLWSFAAPHMRSFHLAWFSFFVVSVG